MQIPHKLERRAAQPGGRQIRSYTLSVKAAEDGTIEGYASVFGVKDNWDDIIVPGAFLATLNAHKAAGTMPALLWQHENDKPIGIWQEMVEDARGLRVKGQLALETSRGKEAHALLKMGAINGLSIGFISKAWSYDNETDVRTLTEVDLWEVSLVTFPANQDARVTSVKSSPDTLETPKDIERLLRDAGFSRSDATALVSRAMRMGEDRRDSAKSSAAALEAAQRLIDTLTK